MNLVVYYSLKGHVKKAAEDYAAKNKCELLEIKSSSKYSGGLGFIKAGYSAVRKKCPSIHNINRNLSAYDKVIIFSPIWAGTMAAPIRTFLRDYGSTIKQLEYVVMHADKTNDYAGVFEEMDVLAKQKHTSAASLVQDESL